MTSNVYNSFKSHSAPLGDGFRPEVWVETGTGTVTKFEPTQYASGIVAKVTIQPSNEAFHLKSGYVGENDVLFAAAEKASKTGEIITFRIESQRKAGTDPRAGMDELRGVRDGQADMRTSKENIKKILVGVNGERGSEALTHPAEDPADDAAGAVTDEVLAGLKNAPNTSNGDVLVGVTVEAALAALAAARGNGFDKTVVDVLMAQALTAGADPVDVLNAGVTPNGDKRPTVIPSRVRAKNNAPYSMFNSDGKLNPASYAVSGGVSMFRVAYDAVNSDPVTESATHSDKVTTALRLTQLMFIIADTTQTRILGVVDRNDNSHGKIRELLFSAIKDDMFGLPYPGVEADNATLREWAKRVTAAVEFVLVKVLRTVDTDMTTLAGTFPVDGPEQGETEPAAVVDTETEQPPAEVPADAVVATQPPEARPSVPAAEQPRETVTPPDALVTQTSDTPTDGGDLNPVRVWAKENGIPFNPRGPVSRSLIKQYESRENAQPVPVATAFTAAVGELAAVATVTEKIVTVIGNSYGHENIAPGQKGYEPPNEATTAAFRELATTAGFVPQEPSGAKLVQYLQTEYNATSSRTIHQPALRALLTKWATNPDGFREHVNEAIL